jgi:thioredoxin-related protein
MKKIALVFIFLSTFLSASYQIGGVNVVYSYQNALHVAKKENKIVLFMLAIEGCPVCGYMKDVVFQRENIKDYLNKHYVMVVKDAEKQNYPDRFYTTDMPTFYFIDPKTEKEVRPPKSGGSTPEKFISVLRIVIEGENNDTIYHKPAKPTLPKIDRSHFKKPVLLPPSSRVSTVDTNTTVDVTPASPQVTQPTEPEVQKIQPAPAKEQTNTQKIEALRKFIVPEVPAKVH